MTLSAAALLGRAGYFVAITATGRRIGAADFGHFALVLSVFVAFSMIANLGLENLAMRTAARSHRETGELIAATAPLRVGAAGMAAIPAVALLLWKPSGWALVGTAGVYGVANGVVLFEAAICRGAGRMGLHTRLLGVQAVATAALVVVATAWSPTATAAMAGYAFAAVAVACWAAATRRSIGVRRAIPTVPVSRTWRLAAPFALGVTALLVFDRSTLVAFAVSGTDEQVGWFSAAYLLIVTLATVPTVLANAVFPSIARAAVDTAPSSLRNHIAMLLGGIAVIGVFVAALTYPLAPTIVELAYGSGFAPSAGMLRRLAFAIPFSFVVSFGYFVMHAVDAQRRCAVSFVVGLVVGLPAMITIALSGDGERAAWAYVVLATVMALSLVGGLLHELSARPALTTLTDPEHVR